jgi:hypothetical protein
MEIYILQICGSVCYEHKSNAVVSMYFIKVTSYRSITVRDVTLDNLDVSLLNLMRYTHYDFHKHLKIMIGCP